MEERKCIVRKKQTKDRTDFFKKKKKQSEGNKMERKENSTLAFSVSVALKTLEKDEKRRRKAARERKWSSSIPPGASLHHHLSHHASPDRTLQMHYGIWGRRARGRRASLILDKTWDDQTEVVRRRGGSSILHHSATWILHGGNSLFLLISSFVSGKFRKVCQNKKVWRRADLYPQPTSHCCFFPLLGSENHRRRVCQGFCRITSCSHMMLYLYYIFIFTVYSSQLNTWWIRLWYSIMSHVSKVYGCITWSICGQPSWQLSHWCRRPKQNNYFTLILIKLY